MQFEKKCAGRSYVDRQLVLVHHRMRSSIILTLQIILAFEQKIEVGGTDDVEWQGAKFLVSGSRLSPGDVQKFCETLDEAGPPKFMLICGNAVQYARWRIVQELVRKAFAKFGPQWHLRGRWQLCI